jgi:hypothetical protein
VADPQRREPGPEAESERPRRRRSAPSLGSELGISVPISFGLPLLAVGLVLALAAIRVGSTAFWVGGVVCLALGFVLFASGKRL